MAKFVIGSSVDYPVVAKIIWTEAASVSGTVINYIPNTALASSTVKVSVPGAADILKKSATYFKISTVLLGCALSMLNF